MKNKPFWSVKNLSEGTEKEEIEVKVYGEIVNLQTSSFCKPVISFTILNP